MPDIVIIVGSVGQGPSAGVMRVRGTAHTEGASDPYEWIADVAIGASAPEVNTAIRDAAVAAAAGREVVVGALDTRTLFGGAVNL